MVEGKKKFRLTHDPITGEEYPANSKEYGKVIVDKYKNKAETANNKRNSDIYARQRASECLVYFSEFLDKEFQNNGEPIDNTWEDLTIHLIDTMEDQDDLPD